MVTTDWRAEYAKAAALQEDGDASAAASSAQQQQKTAEDGVLAFVDLLLTEEGGEWWTKLQRQVKRATQQSDGQEVEPLHEGDKKQLKALKKRLAKVGSELLVKLPELNASVSSKDAPRSAKVRVLQLQLVCRMLCYGTLTKKKKREKKTMKKEIRGLLDRVALLLDAANPPSLADEDADERSPFQEFLQQQLSPRLKLLLPELVQYLLKAYELEEEEETKDDEDNDAASAMLPPLMPVVKPPQPPVELPASGTSILSALRQERPAKRSLPDATGLFKEVQLPQQLQRQQSQSRPRKSRRVSRSHSSASKSSSDKKNRSDKSGQDSLLLAAASAKSAHKSRALDFAGAASLERARLALSARRPGDSDLLRRVALNSSAKGPTAPLLNRAVSDRSHFIGSQAGIRSSRGVAAQTTGTAAAGKTQSPPLRRAATTSSVVMRTPDRPKRSAARTTRRVLVEASPPLRRPSGSGAAAPRLLQPKTSRTGSTPPPLFR